MKYITQSSTSTRPRRRWNRIGVAALRGAVSVVAMARSRFCKVAVGCIDRDDMPNDYATAMTDHGTPENGWIQSQVSSGDDGGRHDEHRRHREQGRTADQRDRAGGGAERPPRGDESGQ